MARNRPSRKPYRPKAARAAMPLRTQPWRLAQTFGPLEEILTHVARGGELHATEEGAWIYVSPTRRQAYEVPATLRAYAEVFTIVHTRDPSCPDPEPLRIAAAAIHAGAVEASVVHSALACLLALWTFCANQPPDVITDAAQSVTLRAHLNALEQIQDPALVG